MHERVVLVDRHGRRRLAGLQDLGDRDRARRRVRADVEDLLERVELADERLDARPEALVDDEEAAARVGEAVLDLLGRPPAVQADADRRRRRSAPKSAISQSGELYREDRRGGRPCAGRARRASARGGAPARAARTRRTRCGARPGPCTAASPRRPAFAIFSRIERSRFFQFFIGRPSTVSVTISKSPPGPVSWAPPRRTSSRSLRVLGGRGYRSPSFQRRQTATPQQAPAKSSATSRGVPVRVGSYAWCHSSTAAIARPMASAIAAARRGQRAAGTAWRPGRPGGRAPRTRARGRPCG